jgi:hypothetical protein
MQFLDSTGKYAPNLALRITKGNEVRDANSFAVNLAGIALGGPLTDPSPVTARYSDYFSSLGLIDNITKLKLREKEVLTAQLIDEGKFGEAYTVKTISIASIFLSNAFIIIIASSMDEL